MALHAWHNQRTNRERERIAPTHRSGHLRGMPKPVPKSVAHGWITLCVACWGAAHCGGLVRRGWVVVAKLAIANLHRQ